MSAEEVELWLSVAARVTPRLGSTLPLRLRPATPALNESAAAPEAVVPAPPLPPSKLPPLAPLERKLRQKLARRRVSVDATLDLHGLRQDEARVELRHFLGSAQAAGFKVVLVITGKGGGHRPADPAIDFSERGGVLRRAVPLWLSMPDLRSLVLGFEEAALTQGGSGALFIRLRRHPRRESFATR